MDGPEKFRILGLYAAVFIAKGDGCLRMRNGRERPVKTGDVVIVFPDTPHAYGPWKEWDSIWVVWGGAEAETIEKMGCLDRSRPVFEDRLRAVKEAHEALQDAMEQPGPGSVLQRKAILLKMLHKLNSGMGWHGLDSRRRISAAADSLLENQGRTNINELAERCGMSQTHFRRLFKELYGESPKRMATSARISRAKELLGSGKTIKDVANELGFRDQFYFMRAFKSSTGQSPGKFRDIAI